MQPVKLRGLQIIVMEHADLKHDWFEDAVVERWRKGVRRAEAVGCKKVVASQKVAFPTTFPPP